MVLRIFLLFKKTALVFLKWDFILNKRFNSLYDITQNNPPSTFCKVLQIISDQKRVTLFSLRLKIGAESALGKEVGWLGGGASVAAKTQAGWEGALFVALLSWSLRPGL